MKFPQMPKRPTPESLSFSREKLRLDERHQALIARSGDLSRRFVSAKNFKSSFVEPLWQRFVSVNKSIGKEFSQLRNQQDGIMRTITTDGETLTSYEAQYSDPERAQNFAQFRIDSAEDASDTLRKSGVNWDLANKINSVNSIEEAESATQVMDSLEAELSDIESEADGLLVVPEEGEGSLKDAA